MLWDGILAGEINSEIETLLAIIDSEKDGLPTDNVPLHIFYLASLIRPTLLAAASTASGVLLDNINLSSFSPLDDFKTALLELVHSQSSDHYT